MLMISESNVVVNDGNLGLEKTILEMGYPAYTTHAGWLGYSDDLVRQVRQDMVIQHVLHNCNKHFLNLALH